MDLGHLALMVIGVCACLLISRRAYLRHEGLEAEIEADRAFLSTVLDSISDGIVACDAEGKLALFNNTSCEMHGLPQHAIDSESWAEQYDLYHFDGKTPMAMDEIPLYRALMGEMVLDSEMVIAPAGREPLAILASGRAMIGPDGRKLGAVVSMHDVTEQRKARNESRQVHQIIESSPNIVFKLQADADWTVEYISDNVRQLGFEPEDFLDGSILFPALIHPDDLPRINAEIEQHTAGDKGHFLLSYRMIDDVGRDRWVDTWLVIIRDDVGLATHCHGIMVDVTDREIISQMLRDSEERMELALEGADLGMWDWDLPSGRGVFNERWCQMLGLDIEHVDNHVSAWESRIHPEDQEMVMAALQAHLRGDTDIYEAEHRLRHADGRWVWVLGRGCVTSRDDRGAALRMTGTHLDITTRKEARAEARILEAQVQQAQKMESLGMLAGGIAHDFNNILMAILGNAELARLDLEDDSPVHEQIKEIESAAARAADLCNQMLAYSGKGRFQVSNVDLASEIQAISRMLSVGISKKIDLRFDLDSSLPGVRADVGQIRQVVMNLITNAAESIGDRDGSIEVRTSLLKNQNCAGRGLHGDPCKSCTDSCLNLEIADTGCGMDEAIRERIFEPFFSTKNDGRGLGMAAVVGIIKSHGGNITIESEPGRGTKIGLCLPCDCVEDKSKAAVECSEIVSAPSGGSILLVDDEESVLRLGARLLISLGWDVLTAEDGLAAVQIIEKNGANLTCVILDVTMPRMGGIEARERIQRLHPELPVILSSGYHVSEIASRIGMDVPFIQKPYRRRDLSRIVEKVTGALV